MVASGRRARDVVAAAGLAMQRIDRALRARYALCRPDPHRQRPSRRDAWRGFRPASPRVASERPSRPAIRPRSLRFCRLSRSVSSTCERRPSAYGHRSTLLRWRRAGARLKRRHGAIGRVWFDGGWLATQIWDRMSLPVGARSRGPGRHRAERCHDRARLPALRPKSIAWATSW
jgi:hypothetical protein